MTNQTLVMKYFESWQQPANFTISAECLSENFTIDSGFFKFNSREGFIKFLSANPTPWKEVRLLSSIFCDDTSTLLYEGINTANNQRMRVAEHIKTNNGLITSIQTVITQLG